jgi:membrane AbrB-like protein
MHIAGGLGAYLLIRLRVPTAALIGSMLGVVVFTLTTRLSIDYPPQMRLAAQVLSGVVIGMRFSRSDLSVLKTMAGPVGVLLVSMVIINTSFGVIMSWTTSLTFMTSLFAAGLGGVADLALIATDFGADMDKVALLQLFRLTTVILVFPPLIKGMLAAKAKNSEAQEPPLQKKAPVERTKPLHFALTLLCALAGGALFSSLHIPAGGILGAIVATALLNINTTKAATPPWMRSFAQIIAGGYIGSAIGIEELSQLQVLFIPYLVLVVEIFAMAYLAAFLLTRLFGFDWPTALFCAAPGGVYVMGLIGEDLGLEPPKIVLMHTVRIMASLALLPILATLLG